MSEYPIQSSEHALVAGMVTGLAIKAGLLVWPDYDEHGNYLASMVIAATEDGPRVRIVVPPPSEVVSRDEADIPQGF